ncbi:MAG: LLM class flavin-dependent oxidoreductase [Alphaproteobacteria bacterium]
MRFSFCIIPNMTVPQVGDAVDRAEQWGADLVWIPDEAYMRDPYVTIGSIATRSRTIDIGVGIANPYTRHPMQLARAIATAADLRKGNMIFGIGAGLKSTRDGIGAPEGEFVATTRDCITVMKRLMRGESVTFENSVFKLNNAKMSFVPTQQVPMYVASTHKDAFVMAGEIADGVIVGNVAEPDAMRQVVAWVHEGAAGAGRDPSSVKIVAWNIAVCTDDAAAAYDCMRAIVAKSIAITHRALRKLMGIDQPRWERIHAAVRHGRGTIDRELVPDRMIDKLAIVGSPKACRQKMLALEEAGADIMAVRTSLDLLARYNWESNVRGLAACLRGAV